MKKYIIPLLSLGLACSCVEDEGSYSYTPMNQVTIGEMQERYNLLAFVDVLEINPTISGSIYGEDEGNYEYKWELCYNNHTHEVIGNERNLSWKADVREGEYNVYLTVKDKNTDVEKIFGATVSVSSPFNTGFLVIGKDMTTGHAALDMVTMPPERDTTVVENVVDMSSLNISNPTSVISAGRRYPGRTDYTRIWINGEEDSYSILGPDSKSVSSLENMGSATSLAMIEIDVPHDRNIVIRDMFPRQNTMMRNNATRGYITNDVIVMASMYTGEYFAQPFNRYSVSSEQLFKPYPLCFCPGAAAYYVATAAMMAYDMDADCFVKLPSSVYTAFVTRPVDYATDPWKFDLKSENRTLVYGENGFESNKGYCYAVVKDAKEENSTRYIYRWSSSAPITKFPLYKVDPAVAPDFDKASHYMFSSNRTAVLYSVGNRLYQYEYSRGLIAHYDFPAEITMIKTNYHATGSVSRFFVATYSDQDKGMIYEMSVPNNPNALEFESIERTDPESGEMVPVQWATRLKVTDIEWKTN